jgi:hypothetical protein
MAIDKPAYGQPCNGCGKCCEHELCPLALKLYGHLKGPCPALTPAGDGPMLCGLVAMPGHYWPGKARRWGEHELSRTAKLAIGAGWGCDFAQGDHDPAVSERLRVVAKALEPERRRVLHVWGIK